MPAASERYRFGSFDLDVAERRLTHGEEEIPLAPKVFDTLVMLVRNAGRLVDKSEFMTAVWPDTFVTDVTLAHNISTLRKALSVEEQGGRQQYIETVPKTGYRFVVAVVSLDTEAARFATPIAPPPVVAPLGAPAEPVSGGWSRRWMVAASVTGLLLVAAAALVSVREAAPTPSAIRSVRSLAVLPFRWLTNDEADRVLALGLTEALISRLSQLREVSLRPLSAVRSFADVSAADAREAGRKLNVDAVLEGHIQQHGQFVRVSTQIVRVSDGTVMWSGVFENAFADLLSLQNGMAAQVAAAIVPELSVSERQRLARRETQDSEARYAYLRGRFYLSRRTPESIPKAIEHLEVATRRDPSYALAYTALAEAHLLSPGYMNTPASMAIPAAKAAADRALALDPMLAEPHAMLALMAMNHEWRWHDADRLYRRSIELSPSYATAHAWYGEFLAFMGRFDEGIARLRYAERLDPLSLIIATDVGKALMLARRYDEAMTQLSTVLEIDPGFAPAHAWRLSSSYYAGRYGEAAELLSRFPGEPDHPNLLAARIVVEAGLRNADRVRENMDKLMAFSRRQHVSATGMAQVYAAVGDLDRAFAWLHRMCDEREIGVLNLRVDPFADPFRRDPRFAVLLRRVGLADDQVSDIGTATDTGPRQGREQAFPLK